MPPKCRTLSEQKNFQGWIVIGGLALATVNLSTKFDVSSATHYGDTEGETKYGKWAGLW